MFAPSLKTVVTSALFLTLITTQSFASKKYCNKLTDLQRTTSIYVDLGNTNSAEFGRNIMSELFENLVPHERVQIFTINPLEASIKQVYNSCAPILSQDEIKKVKEAGSFKYMLGGNPLDAAKEDFTFFSSEIKSVLSRAFQENVSNDADKKELIEMLYGESTNFEEFPMQRVILFSDMLQNSSETKKEDILNETSDGKYLMNYMVNYNNAEFYIFTDKKKLKISEHNKLVKFWKDYFELSNGHVAYFNDSLKLQKTKSVKLEKFEGTLTISGKDYIAKMLISYSDKLEAVNTWFIVNMIDSVPLRGKVKLEKGSLSRAELNVADIIPENHEVFSFGEKFSIIVKGNKLSGTIVIDNTEIVVNGEKIENPTFNISMVRKND